MRVKPKRSKKNPISSNTARTASSTAPSSRASVVSHRLTQSTIAHFHTLLKRQAALKKEIARGDRHDDHSGEHESIENSLKAIEIEMDQLGGLNAYQIASKLGQSRERGGDSSKVFVSWLDELGLKASAMDKKVKLRMLELGALTPDNYASCSSWIDNSPIDLHSQHPSIVEQDFFERPLPSSPDEQFDLISCSLVLNFVSSPADRGKMISLIHGHLKSSPKALLFLVLPLPCLTNSRYLSIRSFTGFMSILGFELVKERWKSGGKVGYWLWRWKPLIPGHLVNEEGSRWRKKLIEVDGPKKNNFAVILP